MLNRKKQRLSSDYRKFSGLCEEHFINDREDRYIYQSIISNNTKLYIKVQSAFTTWNARGCYNVRGCLNLSLT